VNQETAVLETRRKVSPLAARFIIFIVLPLGVLIGASFLYFYRGLPEKKIVIARGGGSISITRNQSGVALLKASNDRDIFFATGYVHGQDRAWQLELLRRTAQGRLSEVLGKATLQQDIWFRTLGIYSTAESAKQTLSKEAVVSLQEYADGVNAALDVPKSITPEFIALGIKPEKWTPIDSLAIVKLMGLSMAGSMTTELERYAAKQVLDPQKLHLLFGDVAGLPEKDAQAQSRSLDLVIALMQQIKATESLLGIGGKDVGSNAWVVSGTHTADGKPMLANDPHMGLSMPSPWYAVTQSGATLNTAGLTLVGTPLVIFGKNASIAWGGTNMMADVQDLFFEQVRGADSLAYRDGNEWKPFRVRYETIAVARATPSWLHDPVPPVRIRVRETVRGPLVSDALMDFDQPVSLRWTGLDSDDSSYEAFYRLSYASDWNTFRAALALQVVPTLNMLYADTKNNIGFTAAGRIPVRAAGHGEIPQPGWTGEYRWIRYVGPASMPHIYNPERGYIVSANDKMADDIYSDFITMDWVPGYRAQRIKSLLDRSINAKRPLDAPLFMAMQGDMLSPEASAVVPILLRTLPRTPLERQVLRHLREWNYHMKMDSSGATIYSVWMQRLQQALLIQHLARIRSTRLMGSTTTSLVSSIRPDVILNSVNAIDGGLCTQRGCAQELRQSFEHAVRDLTKLRGADPDNWRWGDVHFLHLRHTPFSSVPIASALFDRQYGSGGGPYTLNVSNSKFAGSNGYEQTFGATFRQIMQPGPGLHLLIGSTGQSGNPLSQNYADMSALYVRGGYLDISSLDADSKPTVLFEGGLDELSR
jgi:penicillin amidase